MASSPPLSGLALALFFSCFTAGLCIERLYITHAPAHIKLEKDAGNVAISEIPHIIASSYGFSVNKDLKWKGLSATSLFKRPKAHVIFSVDGFSNKGLDLDPKHMAKYNTNNDESYLNTEIVANHLESATFKSRPLVVDFSRDNSVFDVQSRHPQMFSSLSATLSRVRTLLEDGRSAISALDRGHLNISHEADLGLLAEMQLVQEIIDTLKKQPQAVQDNTPDLFHFRLGGFRKVVEEHGINSDEVKDAVTLLNIFLNQVTNEFKALYHENVVIEVLTLAGSEEKILVRKSRSLKADESENDVSLGKKLNLGNEYDPLYPVIFNIILWFMVVFWLTVLAVSYGIWFMDPGRDSIIYRMTSTRMKKD